MWKISELSCQERRHAACTPAAERNIYKKFRRESGSGCTHACVGDLFSLRDGFAAGLLRRAYRAQ